MSICFCTYVLYVSHFFVITPYFFTVKLMFLIVLIQIMIFCYNLLTMPMFRSFQIYVCYLFLNHIVMDNTCRICTKRILSHARTVTCTLCKHNYHCKCISIAESDIRELLSNDEWLCRQCMGNLLPFIHISDDVEFLQCLDHKDFF